MELLIFQSLRIRWLEKGAGFSLCVEDIVEILLADATSGLSVGIIIRGRVSKIVSLF